MLFTWFQELKNISGFCGTGVVQRTHFISSKSGSDLMPYGGLRAGGQSHPQLNLYGMPSSVRHLTAEILPVT